MECNAKRSCPFGNFLWKPKFFNSVLFSWAVFVCVFERIYKDCKSFVLGFFSSVDNGLGLYEF